MVKISVALRFRIPLNNTEKMHRRRIRAHREQMSEFERGRIIELKEQDNAKPHTTRVAMNCLTAYQTLPWPAISPNPSPIDHVGDMMGRRLHLSGNVDDLV
ncbi:transposable element Tc1 transposase [Trichonephila clavipes]|nr:transposable element Tc1 transposase [Trichonephila clavipes]